ncbi:hypothetical protein [Micromonospora sp. HUAS LYJ1]|uniref:hypothetical protein n=1 Tax=Micromonospora sp. HUAS LYJ1 TaxID=3061626 RepID=UPI0026710BC6|nr:hypothetical protein [Micromonospora sp. HUAS LYJ1]WKU04121.1 hypothetical protein Q2K16_25390 [Micromonospora sp. HUAS LYJ1]
MDGIWLVVAGVAPVALLGGRWAARRGRTAPPVERLLGFGLAGTLLVGAVAGVALFAWSVGR